MKIRSFIFIALIFIMTGCITVGDLPGQARVTVSPTSGADLNHAIFFPRQKKSNGERVVMDGETTGTLMLVDKCLRLESNQSDTSYMLIWPPDFKFLIESDAVKILNEDGINVATVGDFVYMGGGEVHLLLVMDKFIQEQIPSQCDGPYWIIGDKISRLDQSE